jgi:alkylation response protein AidB-like acyl-CoA dehydrogenase
VDLDLTEDQRLFLDTTVRFIESELPIASTRDLHSDPRGYDEAWLRKSAELGWYAMLVPEAYGGGSLSGNGLVDAAIVAETLGRFVQPGPFTPINVVADALVGFGSDEQRSRLLPALAGGETVVTWAPLDGSAQWDLGASLRLDERAGRFHLTGERGVVQDAQTAELILVCASDNGRLRQLLVPTQAAGVKIHPLTCLDLTRRAGLVTFDDVVVDADAIVTLDDSEASLERQLQVALTLTVAETVGALDAMVSMTVGYAKERVAFGRPIGSFQALKHILADVTLYLEASKAASVALTRAVAERADDVAEITAIVASYVGDHATEIAQQCLQIHGGIGCTWEHDLHLLMRRTRANSSWYGTPSWHRERICALHGLGGSDGLA